MPDTRIGQNLDPVVDLSILLVEDNPDHAVLVQAMLDYRGIGGRVYVTQNIAEAKSYLLGEWPFDDPARNPTPQLVVLDHWLDDGTGLELLGWLKEMQGLGEIPVVVFTGCRDPLVKKRAEELGVVGYFLKPEGFESLGEIIENFVDPTRKDDPLEGGDQGPGSALAG